MIEWIFPTGFWGNDGGSTAPTVQVTRSSHYLQVVYGRACRPRATAFSFATVVHMYARMRGGVASGPILNDIVRKASSDIADILSRHNWNFMIRTVAIETWGTKELTLKEISENQVRVEEETDYSLIGQRLTIPGSDRWGYWIVGLAGDGSIVMDSQFSGTPPKAGDKITVTQVRVPLPCSNFQLLGPVLVNQAPVPVVDARDAYLHIHGAGVGSLAVAIEPGFLVLTYPVKGVVRVRFKQFPVLIYYDAGMAEADETDRRHVRGRETRWSLLERFLAEANLVLEEGETLENTVPYGELIAGIRSDDELVLTEEWRGPSPFSYVISTGLDWPHYMWPVVEALARFYGGKADARELANAVLNARSVDQLERIESTGVDHLVGGIRIIPDFG